MKHPKLIFLLLLLNPLTSMIITSLHKQGSLYSLKTLRQLTLRRSSLNCLFAMVPMKRKPCYHKSPLALQRPRYVTFLTTIIKQTIIKQDCCHKLTIQTSYVQCKAIIEQKLTPFVRYNRNSIIQKKRLDGIINSLLVSMRQTSSVVKLRGGKKRQSPVLQKIGMFVQSKVADVLKKTNATGRFNNITINVYNNTKNVTGSVVSGGEEAFKIFSDKPLSDALRVKATRRFNNNYVTREKLRGKAYGAFGKRTGPLISDKPELNRLRKHFANEVEDKDGFKFHKEKKPIQGKKTQGKGTISKIVHKPVVTDKEQKPVVADKEQKPVVVAKTNVQKQPIAQNKETIQKNLQPVKEITPHADNIKQTQSIQQEAKVIQTQKQNNQTIQSNQNVQTQNKQTIQGQTTQVTQKPTEQFKVKKSGSSSNSSQSKETENKEIEVVKKAPGADVRGNMNKVSPVDLDNSVKDAKKETTEQKVVDGTTPNQANNMALNAENNKKDKKDSSSSSEEDAQSKNQTRARKVYKVAENTNEENKGEKEAEEKSGMKIVIGTLLTVVALAM